MISRRARACCRWSAAGILLSLLSCSAEPSTQAEPFEIEEPGSVAGELAVYIATFDDGTSETRYFLRDATGDERRLFFERDPDLTPGARLKVWGTPVSEGLQVARFKASLDARVDGIGSAADPLTGVTPVAPRILCPVLVTINNGAVPANLGVSQIEAQFHVGPTSVNAYYRENSYGKNGIGGKTYGPFNYNMATCDTSGMASAIRPMVPAADGCQQYAFVMVPNQSSCGWGGLGSVGTSDKPARDTWYNSSLSCVVTVQEPGHNFGGQHSSSISCAGAPASAGGITDSLAGCTHSEYGDRFDTMGGGCRHFNAWQKFYQKWWGGCNGVKVNSTGTFNLYPTEIPCNGVQALQIPFPGGKTRPFASSGGGGPAANTTLTSWYLEYRTSTGFDKGMTPQVLVHMGVDPVLPTQANPRGVHTWIVNASGTATNPGLTAGGSFTDPAGGLTVTVMSLDATKAVIQVNVANGSGPSVCLDGMNTPFTAPGPTDCTSIPPPSDGGVITGAGGMGGTGGSGGTGGTAGRGGSAGQAGAGGVRDAGRDGTGSGGTIDGGNQGGSAGQGGGGGSSGSTGGSGGNAQGGAGGATTTSTGQGGSMSGAAGSGQAGSSSTAGSGGSGGTGTAGSSGAGTSGRRSTGADDVGGCACRIDAHPSSGDRSPAGGMLALALGGLIEARRRSRRRAGAREEGIASIRAPQPTRRLSDR